jgi:hypothetical protein
VYLDVFNQIDLDVIDPSRGVCMPDPIHSVG